MTDEELAASRQYVDTVLNPKITELDCEPSPAEFPAYLLRQALDEIERLRRILEDDPGPLRLKVTAEEFAERREKMKAEAPMRLMPAEDDE